MTLSVKPGEYLITPGGHVALPAWYKPKEKSTMSIPGRRSERIRNDGLFDPPA